MHTHKKVRAVVFVKSSWNFDTNWAERDVAGT